MARSSKLTPAPYEKAQTSEEKIYMQAVRSSRQLSTEVLAVHECVVSEGGAALKLVVRVCASIQAVEEGLNMQTLRQICLLTVR